MIITLAFATPTRIWQQVLEVPAGTTVAQAVALSDFAREFPEYTDHPPAHGIFGRQCRPDQPVSEGDRVELYRPLVFDPGESRRRRAEHRQKRTPGEASAPRLRRSR